MKTKYITSMALAMLLFGCSDNTDHNTNNNATQAVKVSADMGAGTVTIDGKRVNLSDIPIPAVQPKQLTITPKLLYTLAYEASGGNENRITIIDIDIEYVDEQIAEIKRATGINPDSIKQINPRKQYEEDEKANIVDIVLDFKTKEEAIKMANYMIGKTIFFKAGLAQVNTSNFAKEMSEEEYQLFLQGSIKDKLTIPTTELFTTQFAYKMLNERLQVCSSNMGTIGGILECSLNKNGNYFKDDFNLEKVGELYTLDQEGNITKSERYAKAEKTQLDKMKSLEKMGTYNNRYNSFQTTYKKLFGSEYIK